MRMSRRAVAPLRWESHRGCQTVRSVRWVSTWMRPCVARARTSTLTESLEAENTKPPTPDVGDTRLVPRLVMPNLGTGTDDLNQLITVIEAEADDVILADARLADGRLADGRIAGLRLRDGRAIRAGAVVLTTGTFLRGLIHIGEQTIAAGRLPPASSTWKE